MALTRKEYIGNGSTTLYNVDFDLGYIDKDYVFVYLETSTPDDQLSYVWRNDNQIELLSPVTNGAKFYIRRMIPRDQLVNDYEDGAILREGNLNDSYLQTLMILEEVQDGFITVDDEFLILAKVVLAQDLNMNEFRITNLPVPLTSGEPLRRGDVAGDGLSVSKEYVDGQIENLDNQLDTLNTQVSGIDGQVDDVVNYLQMKVFQAPTEGGLKEIQTRTTVANEVYEVREVSDGSLATIYSDKEGTNEIIQNGTENKSSSNQLIEFFIEAGSYYILVGSTKSIFTVTSGIHSTKTSVDKNWYVDPVSGIDSPLMGSSSLTPFKTIQYAFDQLPDIISHQQTINVSSGICNESSRDSSDMPRPAILYPQGKYIARRTSQSGSDLSGSVVIKGAGVGITIIETDPSNGYVNGVYVSGTEIAIQDLTIRPKSGESTSTCITSHRGAYIHGRNLAVGGAGSSLGLVCESGAWAEMVSCAITGSDNKDVVVFPTSGCSLAGDNSDIGDVQSSGFIQFAQQLTVNGDVSVTSSGNCQITSNVLSNAVVFNGAVTVSNAPLSAAFATFNESITATLSTIKLSACSYQKSITLFGGGLDLDASNSFVSPDTNNDTTAPVILRDGARIDKDSASIIRNKVGIEVGADFGNLSVTVTSDNFDIPIAITGRHIDMELIGASSNRLGAKLPSSGDLGEYPDGTVVRIAGAGFNVEIIESTTANIPNGSVVLGGLSGGYSGATFVYSSRAGKWNLQSIGILET